MKMKKIYKILLLIAVCIIAVGLRMAFFTVDVVAVFHKQRIFSGGKVGEDGIG